MKTTVNLIIMKNVCIYQIILYIKVGATSSLCRFSDQLFSPTVKNP